MISALAQVCSPNHCFAEKHHPPPKSVVSPRNTGFWKKQLPSAPNKVTLRSILDHPLGAQVLPIREEHWLKSIGDVAQINDELDYSTRNELRIIRGVSILTIRR
jgi:hypothetical protein